MNGFVLVLSGVVFFLIVLVLATALKCSQDKEKNLLSTGNHAPRINGTNNLTRRNSGGGTNDFVIDTGDYWGASDFGEGSIQRETWIQEPAPPYVPCCSSHLCDQVLQIEQIPESPPPAYDSCQPNVNGFLFYTVQDRIERLNS